MRLTIVVHVKTRHDRPSFSVYNYGILTYDSCKRKMWLDFAVVLEYKYRMIVVNWQIARTSTCDILFLSNNLQNIQLPLKIITLLDTVRNSDSSGIKNPFSKKNNSCKLSRRYRAVNIAHAVATSQLWIGSASLFRFAVNLLCDILHDESTTNRSNEFERK